MADGENVDDVNDVSRNVDTPPPTNDSNNPLPGQSEASRIQSQAQQNYQSSAFVESLTSALSSLGVKNIVEAAEFSLSSPTGKDGDGLLVEMSSMDGVVDALYNTVNRLDDINDTIRQNGVDANSWNKLLEARSDMAMQSVKLAQQSVMSNQRDEVVNTTRTLEKQTNIHKEVRDVLIDMLPVLKTQKRLQRCLAEDSVC